MPCLCTRGPVLLAPDVRCSDQAANRCVTAGLKSPMSRELLNCSLCFVNATSDCAVCSLYRQSTAEHAQRRHVITLAGLRLHSWHAWCDTDDSACSRTDHQAGLFISGGQLSAAAHHSVDTAPVQTHSRVTLPSFTFYGRCTSVAMWQGQQREWRRERWPLAPSATHRTVAIALIVRSRNAAIRPLFCRCCAAQPPLGRAVDDEARHEDGQVQQAGPEQALGAGVAGVAVEARRCDRHDACAARRLSAQMQVDYSAATCTCTGAGAQLC